MQMHKYSEGYQAGLASRAELMSWIGRSGQLVTASGESLGMNSKRHFPSAKLHSVVVQRQSIPAFFAP